MNRYIDADKTLDELDEFFDTNYWGNTPFIDGVVRIVNNQKPADVAPVAHAHWIYETHKIAENVTITNERCSLCGGVSKTGPTEFCPHCGAKMDEEEGTE